MEEKKIEVLFIGPKYEANCFMSEEEVKILLACNVVDINGKETKILEKQFAPTLDLDNNIINYKIKIEMDYHF